MIPEWKEVTGDHYVYYELVGTHCEIILMPRPVYCDRGKWYALVQPRRENNGMVWFAQNIDGQDGWPRYYFFLDSAKRELEEWMIVRGELSRREIWMV